MSERDKIPNTGDPLDVMNWAMKFGDWEKATLDGLHTSRVAALADELTTLRTQLAEAKADNARLREAIESEPELPGDMPDEMWDALRHADRETMTEVLRACVRTTKAGILRAYTEGSK